MRMPLWPVHDLGCSNVDRIPKVSWRIVGYSMFSAALLILDVIILDFIVRTRGCGWIEVRCQVFLHAPRAGNVSLRLGLSRCDGAKVSFVENEGTCGHVKRF